MSKHMDLKIKSRKAIVLVSIFLLLLLLSGLIAVSVVLYRRSKAKHVNSKNTYSPYDTITLACNKTQNPTLCVSSLSSYTDSSTADHIQLAQIATKMTLEKVKVASNAFQEVASTFSDMDPDTIVRSAHQVCVQLQDESVDLLQKSYTTIGQKLTIESNADVLTWQSAVLTNQDTCIDGLKGVDGEWKKRVEEHLKDLRESASFSLTLFSNSVQYMNLAPSRQKSRRKLLSNGFPVDDTGFPTWLNRRDRRLLSLSDARSRADYVVAQDGSGKYETIASAIKDVPRKSSKRTIIYVKSGRYEEELIIEKDVTNLMLVGDGMGRTIITGSKSDRNMIKTYLTASFGISGSGFIARDLTFENRAGPENHQAVALRLSSDKSVVYKCEITGYQDTLYVHNQRQFFRECVISGTVDFIFGNAAVVLQECTITARRPLPSQKNTITAQGRKQIDQTSCITIQNSILDYERDLNKSVTESYLGRPWKKYSRVVIIESFINDHIHPEGWLRWGDENYKDNTVYYGEYGNIGPGANVAQRVKWPGYHALTSREDVRPFGVDELISGWSWLPGSGVPFNAGL